MGKRKSKELKIKKENPDFLILSRLEWDSKGNNKIIIECWSVVKID